MIAEQSGEWVMRTWAPRFGDDDKFILLGQLFVRSFVHRSLLAGVLSSLLYSISNSSWKCALEGLRQIAALVPSFRVENLEREQWNEVKRFQKDHNRIRTRRNEHGNLKTSETHSLSLYWQIRIGATWTEEESLNEAASVAAGVCHHHSGFG